MNNRLPFIVTRLPSIGVTEIPMTYNFHNYKATIHWSNKNIDNGLPGIMTRLPSIGVTQVSTIDYLL